MISITNPNVPVSEILRLMPILESCSIRRLPEHDGVYLSAQCKVGGLDITMYTDDIPEKPTMFGCMVDETIKKAGE